MGTSHQFVRNRLFLPAAVRKVAVGAALLLCGLCVSWGGLPDTAMAAPGDAEAGKAAAQLLTAAPADGGRPFFSIVLPAGWTMVPGKGLPDKFSFKSPDGPQTYIFAAIKFPTPDVIEKELTEARSLPERSFLQRGESGQMYFDPWLYATWKKVFDDRGGVSVTVQFWDNRRQTFYLHDTVSNFDSFAPTMQRIVNLIRLHGDRPNSVPEATIPFQELDPHVFSEDPFSDSGRSPLAVSFVVLVASGVVGMMWFEHKRRQKRLEEITQEIEERKMLRAEEQNVLNAYRRQ